MADHLEDRVDAALLQKWLAARSTGEAEMISLSAFEEELRRDGLLPS